MVSFVSWLSFDIDAATGALPSLFMRLVLWSLTLLDLWLVSECVCKGFCKFCIWYCKVFLCSLMGVFKAFTAGSA